MNVQQSGAHMYYPYHPLLQELLAEHLDGKPVQDPRIESLLTAVNDFYEQASASRQQLELLKAAYNHLEQFAGVVAHDLRAPVRSISSLALWISEEAGNTMPEEARLKVSMLIDKAGQLEKLINGIMSYSRAGTIENEKDYVNLRLLLENSISLLGAEESLQVSLEGDFPDIYTARVPLQQVFLNIISNTMRHAGHSTLRIRCGYGYNGLVFAFLDNGPGIPSAMQEKLFSISAGNKEGHGIGLSITRKLIEQNGGKLHLQSSQERGTCFSFDWPCEILTQGKTA